MSTKYRGSLGFLVFVSLIVLSLGCPLRGAAQPTEALAPDVVVAVDPPQKTVDAQETFSVAVTIADAPELQSYEFILRYDPAVVEVEAVERGPFMEGKSPFTLGPDIDNEAGTMTFGVLSIMIAGPYASGSGDLATIHLKAVGDGSTALDLRDVDLLDSNGTRIEPPPKVEDGQVQVGEVEGEGEVPTATPTEEAAASDTPAPTSTATATEATPPPEATATKTPTGGVTSAPEATVSPTEAATSPPGATATEPPTGGATSPPGATATEPPTEGGTPAATGGATSTAQPGETPERAEGSPSATAEPVEGGGEDVEPTATGADEPPGEETPSGSTWLILAAVLLGVAGVALIGVGVFASRRTRRPGEEPMDDDSKE